MSRFNPDPNWGGKRAGAGRVRKRINLSLEGARDLAELKKRWPKSDVNEVDIIEALIREKLPAPVQTNDKGTILYPIRAEG